MASIVDICNLALSKIGSDESITNIDPPDGSQESDSCARFYPIALDIVLTAHNWGFATQRAKLAALKVDTFGFSFAYAVPSDCKKIISILNSGQINDNQNNLFEQETNADGQLLVRTNIPNAVIVYTKSITDTRRFSGQFIDALVYKLASFLAGKIIKGTTGMQIVLQMEKLYMNALSIAKSQDVSQKKFNFNGVTMPTMASRN